MKILIVGDGHSAIHEVAVVDAFKKLEHEVKAFYWTQYFSANNVIVRLWRRVQNKFIFGPRVNKLNADLVTKAKQFNPDLIFIYRGTHVCPNTILDLKGKLPYCKVVGYNNDDPFAKGHPFWLWRHFLASLPEYDIVLAYRQHNIDDFKRAGAKQVHLLRSWFIPERNHPVTLSPEDQGRFACDVVFVGHYEPDGRLEMLEEIVRAGFHLRLFGPGYDWDPVLQKSALLRHLIPVPLVWGDEYNKALCGAKIALCFFSKLNRDTYTRRCFEIPASGTMMLSEYSDDIANLYREGLEADFFRSKEELSGKIEKYLENAELRQSIAAAGHLRVIGDGHDVVSRMKKVVELAMQYRRMQEGE